MSPLIKSSIAKKESLDIAMEKLSQSIIENG